MSSDVIKHSPSHWYAVNIYIHWKETLSENMKPSTNLLQYQYHLAISYNLSIHAMIN